MVRQHRFDIATLVLSAADIPEYALHALKVLLGWPHHELTNQADRIAEVRSSDSQVYEASYYLSEPFLVADLSGLGAKLYSSV